MDNKYSVMIGWSDEDACYIARIQEFKYLSAFGDTKEEALKEIEIALELSVQCMKEDGEELPEPIYV